MKNTAADLGFEQTRWHTFLRKGTDTPTRAVRRFRDIAGHGNQLSMGVSARSRLNGTVYRNHIKYQVYLECMRKRQSPVEQS